MKHTVISEFSSGIRSDLLLNTERVLSLIDDMISFLNTPSPYHTIRSLASTLKDQDLVIAEAYEGPSLIILNRS